MKLPKQNSIWLGFSGTLVVGVVALVGFGVSELTDLLDRPGPPRNAPSVQALGTTPQERAAALTASATADATEVARYNADVSAWATERANARTASLALLAGAVALLTAAVAAATHAETVRKNRSDSQGAAAIRADDRFATAIEHLSHQTSLGVRIGAIYSLEALGREDEERIQTIQQVLLAFTHSWWVPAREWAEEPIGREPYPAPDDVRLAFAAAARIRQSGHLNLSHSDLSDAELRGAELGDSDLRGAVMTGADLSGARLAQAELQGANLTGARLLQVDLRFARLDHAHLNRALLDGASLYGCTLAGAVFDGVDLSRVDLREVSLEGAHLSGASLFGVDLSETPTGGATLIGANNLGSHLSHRRLDIDAFFLSSRVHVVSGTHAGKEGVIEETQFVRDEDSTRGGVADPATSHTLFVTLRLADNSKLVLPNSRIRPGPAWGD